MEYVGNVAYLSGGTEERKRAREYLRLLMEQRLGPVHVQHTKKRADCVVIDIPVECVGYVTGYKVVQACSSSQTFFRVVPCGQLKSALTLFASWMEARIQRKKALQKGFLF